MEFSLGFLSLKPEGQKAKGLNQLVPTQCLEDWPLASPKVLILVG